MLEFLFGTRKTPAEMLKQHQRALTKAQRELDRERAKLEQQEKKLILDIKKTAKANQMGACKVMAKDLVRTRRNIQKFYEMRTQLQGVSLKIQTLRSNQQMTDALKGVSRVMKQMNQAINLPQITKIMADFERESEMMDMKEEMTNEAMDEVLEGEGDEVETDAIVNQVLDEIGINLNQSLVDAPQNRVGGVAIAATAESSRQPVALSEDDALQARLDSLRRG